MHWIDWIIMLVPFTAVLALAIYAKRYARDVVDFLAAGRVAGRYVICVGDVAAALSVIISEMLRSIAQKTRNGRL